MPKRDKVSAKRCKASAKCLKETGKKGMTDKKSIAFHNLGCKVNGYEMEFMQQTCRKKGYRIVPFDEKADVYVINTCTVTNIADRKSRQMIRRARAGNPQAVVVAVGCYVQAQGEDALKELSIDLAIGNNRKGDLLPLLEEYLERRDRPCAQEEISGQENHVSQERGAGDETDRPRQAAVLDIAHTGEYEEMELESTGEHTRAFVKVQDGCNQFCSYCIIPHVRGRIRSRRMEDAVREVQGLVQKGYREVVLTGIHLSSYGMSAGQDFSHSRLLELLTRISGQTGIERIRLGSLEPRIITREFVRGLKECEALCPHFHLSLQSGCDSVLKRMNRKYTAEEYYEKVCMLREAFDDPAITTDVIVGFPGESCGEFERTRDFLGRVGFYEMHVFKYSRRAGTAAEAMEGQIPEPEKALRSGELISLGQEMSLRYRQAHLHKKAEVLFEERRVIGRETYQTGFTREYIRVAVKDDVLSGENLAGQIREGEPWAQLTPDILLFHL